MLWTSDKVPDATSVSTASIKRRKTNIKFTLNTLTSLFKKRVCIIDKKNWLSLIFFLYTLIDVHYYIR